MWLEISDRVVWIEKGAPEREPLRQAAEFLKAGNRAEAQRFLDRAWRIAPQHAGPLGAIYGAQLLADGNAQAALAVLSAADKVDPRPDTDALIVRALEKLGRYDEAARRTARPVERTIDGRTTTADGVISGWVRVGPDPTAPYAVEVTDEEGRAARAATEPHPSGNSRLGFELSLKHSKLKGTRFTVRVVLPGGEAHPLPDSPFLLEPGEPPKPSRVTRGRASRPSKVDVVIPVYGGYDDTIACIESVLAHARPPGDVVVIDDRSPEPKLSKWLDAQARRKRLTLLRNERNLGFSASVNRGLALNPDRDVVVLNSDTLVHGNWLYRLRTAAYSAKKIASVTPLTNDGSVASYPRHKATMMTADEAIAMDRLAARVNRGKTAELPVGVGFCQYLRRDALEATGELDTRVFGAGYGEEVDLCMRARAKGWRHILAADTFVLHKGGSSFGTRREALMDRGQRLINLRYPRFQRLVDDWAARDPLREVSRPVAEARMLERTRRAVLLVSLHAGLGGVERFVEERRRAMESDGLTALVLRPSKDGRTITLSGSAVDAEELRYQQPGELPTLAALLRKLSLAHVELHHFMGMTPQLVELIRSLKKPYDAYIHDYVWLCPQITLIDHTGRYCGEPDLKACERCIRRTPPNLPEKISVAALRKRSAKWLSGARRVISPSADVAGRLTRYFPDLHIDIHAWQPEPRTPPRFVHPRQRVRVALLGAIGVHKGYDVLLACARDAARRELPLEFSVIGFSENDPTLLATGRIFASGRYEEAEVAQLLRREDPHVILLPSVWPETWSYTLTHALETGLPLAAFDLGTIAERMHGLKRGLLLPITTSPRELNDHLLSMATSPAR